MGEPKRYTTCLRTMGQYPLASMSIQKNGPYVLHADYLSLQQICDAQVSLLESAADWLVAGVQQYEQTSEDNAGGYRSPWDEAADKLAGKIKAAIDAGRES